MRVLVNFTEFGQRVADGGCSEIRGISRDPNGWEYWSVKVTFWADDRDHCVVGVATFLMPEVEGRFSQEFEVFRGATVFARCTPVHGSD